MEIVSAGVAISWQYAWQNGHGALEIVLVDMAGGVEATRDDHAVCHL